MTIAVILPAFNIAPFIGEAIRSVMDQSHTDWRLIVVDDGSTDATAAIAAAFSGRRTLLLRQANAGVSAARNHGLEAIAGAESVLFLDGDDVLAPHALASLSEGLHRMPAEVAAVGPYTRFPGPRRVRRPRSGDVLKSMLVRNAFANGGHVLIRRAALDRAGPFRTHLRYGEDWEYWVRLACLGPFAPASSSSPLLYVRERPGGAYLSMAARPESFRPCMDAIFGAPGLAARLSPEEIAHARRQAEAENDWIVGRELLRHGRGQEGLPFLRRSLMARPGPKRAALLAAAALNVTRFGPFRRYPRAEAGELLR